MSDTHANQIASFLLQIINNQMFYSNISKN